MLSKPGHNGTRLATNNATMGTKMAHRMVDIFFLRQRDARIAYIITAFIHILWQKSLVMLLVGDNATSAWLNNVSHTFRNITEIEFDMHRICWEAWPDNYRVAMMTFHWEHLEWIFDMFTLRECEMKGRNGCTMEWRMEGEIIDIVAV